MRIKKCSHKCNSKRCRHRYRGGEGEPQEEKKNETGNATTNFFKDLKMPDMSSISNIFNDNATPTSNAINTNTSTTAANAQSWWGGYRKKRKTNNRRNKRNKHNKLKTRKNKKIYKRK
jgi:hypothetical protein